MGGFIPRDFGFHLDVLLNGASVACGKTLTTRPIPPMLHPVKRPIADQFAMVPRAFSDRFFKAITTFYACDEQSWLPPVPWWQPVCGGGFEESVLFRHLHASDVPYRYYLMFDYKITRGELGGMCQLGQAVFVEACTLLEMVGAFRSPLNRCAFAQVLAFTLLCVRCTCGQQNMSPYEMIQR